MVKVTREKLKIHDLMFNESPTPFTPNWPPGFKPLTPSPPSDTDGPEGSAKSSDRTSDQTPRENPPKHP
jgi:hypothetical protein